jgi:prolyl-tRNA synthetase
MRWSRLLIPTLREDPAAAESVGERLLLRAGYMRRVAGYLFLGQRSLLKVMAILRREMNAIGAQEMYWASPGEPAVSVIARSALRSYKQLPQIWYRIEMPRHDSYSFDLDAAARESSWQKHDHAFRRVLACCGVDVTPVGDSRWRELVVFSESGPDSIATCACGYAANRETATATPTAPPLPDPGGDRTPEQFCTPGRKTITEVSAFTGLPESAQIKSLVLVAKGRSVLVLLRGDHQLSGIKFAAITGDPDFRPSSPEEIRQVCGADAGSLGPLGLSDTSIFADLALQGRRNMIAGANRDDYHLRHVTPGEDFAASFHDLRRVEAGDSCARCGAPLALRHATTLSRFATESLDLHVTSLAGDEVTPALASYRLDIGRILSVAVEAGHDSDGLVLSLPIAPFTVVVTPVNTLDVAQRDAAHQIYAACLAAGLDALLDDRDERPGVKFKDADLIGVPLRINVGKKLAAGAVELVERRGRKSTDIPVANAAAAIWEAAHHGRSPLSAGARTPYAT